MAVSKTMDNQVFLFIFIKICSSLGTPILNGCNRCIIKCEKQLHIAYDDMQYTKSHLPLADTWNIRQQVAAIIDAMKTIHTKLNMIIFIRIFTRLHNVIGRQLVCDTKNSRSEMFSIMHGILFSS